MANRSKYRKNRQLWRKFYGPKRRKPDSTSFVDPVTQEEVTYDLHRTVRHRDYFIIKGRSVDLIPPGVLLAEYDDGLIEFNNTTTASGSFNFCFSDTPHAVVLTVDPVPDNSHFVNPYGLTFDSCSLSIGLSAPFTGNVRYRAVYSATGYPAFATSSLSPTSGTFRLAAGSVNPAGATAYTASYADLSTTPTVFYRTPWDSNMNDDVNVAITAESVTSTTTMGEISAPLNNPIYFMAVYIE